MIRAFSFLSFLVVLQTFVSCEERKPEVDIKSPQNGQLFHVNQPVEITAKIFDSDAIAAESVVVTYANDTVYKYIDHEFRSDSHTLTKTFVPVSIGNYKIEVGAFGHSSWTFESVQISAN